MTLNLILLLLMLLMGLWTVMTGRLLKSALGLAMTSVCLTILMFRLDSPLAAVFELSVCAGLISVIFISVISLTHPMSQEQKLEHMRQRMIRFWILPVLLLAAGGALAAVHFIPPAVRTDMPRCPDVRVVLWSVRQLDLIGQVTLLLTGVFGIVLLFKETEEK